MNYTICHDYCKFEARWAGSHAPRVMAAALMMSWVEGHTTWWSSLGVLPQTPAGEAVEVLEEVVYKSLISFSFFFAIKQWIVKRIIALSLGLSSGSEAIILGFPAMHTLNTQDIIL